MIKENGEYFFKAFSPSLSVSFCLKYIQSEFPFMWSTVFNVVAISKVNVENGCLT